MLSVKLNISRLKKTILISFNILKRVSLSKRRIPSLSSKLFLPQEVFSKGCYSKRSVKTHHSVHYLVVLDSHYCAMFSIAFDSKLFNKSHRTREVHNFYIFIYLSIGALSREESEDGF